MWHQKTIILGEKTRGFHLITDELCAQLGELGYYQVGTLHLLLQHTSAGLTLNENADPSVRVDFNRFINKLVPEKEPYFTHTYEGDDDMPAHIKSSLTGAELTIPISNGRLALGTWQGIYLGEYRNHGGQRRIVATLNGLAG